MKNRDLKMSVKVKGLDELKEKLKELQKLLEEINSETIVVTTTYGDETDIQELTEELTEKLKDGKTTLSHEEWKE